MGAHRYTWIHTAHGSGCFFFACTFLAVIRARRQRAAVEEQERNSAAHSGKWKDITAPLGFGLPRSRRFLITSNFLHLCVCVFVSICAFVGQHKAETTVEITVFACVSQVKC